MIDNRKIVLKVLEIIPHIKNILEENNNIEIEEKEGNSNFVTNIDKKIERYLTNSILEIFPKSLIIAEESAEKVVENVDTNLIFNIDPLDGTTNFINGWPYATSIGIVNNNELIGGIIYEILEDNVYIGIKGDGVYKSTNINILNSKKINNNYDLKCFEKVKTPVYNRNKIERAVICYDIPYGNEAYENTKKLCSELYYSKASLKTIGPISLDVLKLALGKENRPKDYNLATWHMEVRSWDLAAATCILRELGGEIIGKDGNPLTIETLTSPSKKITFFASGNESLRNILFDKYKKIINN